MSETTEATADTSMTAADMLSADDSGSGGGANDTVEAGAAKDAVVDDAARAEWLKSLPDDEARALANKKGWASLPDILKSYTNVEKLMGGDKVALPKGPDDKEGLERVYKALGRPDDPSGYQLPVPTGADGAFAKTAAGWFHEAGLNPAQARMLAEKFNTHAAGAQAAEDEAFKVKSGQEVGELRTEWGDKFPANFEIAKRAARQFGLGQEALAKMERGLGTKGLMTFLHKVGSGLAEDSFETGGGDKNPTFRMSPAAAEQRKAALMGDPDWVKRYTKGGAPERAEMDRLNAAIAASAPSAIGR